jgi:UDP-N-acetylglucosamine 2-epimerase (hydrolysing)
VKKILFITGTRADFSKIEPLAAAIVHDHTVGFFVTGMHLQSRFGMTKMEVRRFPADYFFEFDNDPTGSSSLQEILIETIKGLEVCIKEFNPDLLVIHGDRVEAFAASIYSAFSGLRSAHIEGGEVSGALDEQLRHCNTKLCGKHFVSNDTARERVARLGEQPETVYAIGSPELDLHQHSTDISFADVFRRYGVSFIPKDYAILIYHPVDDFTDRIEKEAQLVFESIIRSKKNFVVIFPNNDPGSEYIFRWLDRLKGERFILVPSMRASHFSILLRNAAVFVGNSSAGVREAPFLGIPTINVGSRQQGRHSCDSIFDVSLTSGHFDKLIEDCWDRRFESSSAFGTGDTGAKFKDILATAEFWKFSFPKQFYDGSE